MECLSAMMVGMKSRRDQIALAAEALYKMFDKGEEELVSQVNQHLHTKAEIANLSNMFLIAHNLLKTNKYVSFLISVVLLNYLYNSLHLYITLGYTVFCTSNG